jgi:hypothetical protein
MPNDFVSGLILAVVLVLVCQIPWLAFLWIRERQEGDGGFGGEGVGDQDPGSPPAVALLPEDAIDPEYLEELWRLSTDGGEPEAERIESPEPSIGSTDAEPSQDADSSAGEGVERPSKTDRPAPNPFGFWTSQPPHP